jgi:hypothetical protein
VDSPDYTVNITEVFYMSWLERLQELEKEAKRTAYFSFSKYSQELYYKLQAAISKRDAESTRKLIIKLGF